MAPRTAPSHVCITGLGMVSSLGHDVVASCAAARSGIVASEELSVLSFGTDEAFGRETLDGPPAVFGHVVQGVADGFTGVGKMLMLGAAALADLLRVTPLDDRELSRTGIFVILSDKFVEDAAHARRRRDLKVPEGAHERPAFAEWTRRSANIVQRMLDHAGIPLPEAQRHIVYAGHAGVVSCVDQATRLLEKGALDRCIIAGIDSRADAPFLTAAAALAMLRTNENPVGLIPGEAAAVFMLERIDRARHPGPRVSVATTALARDADSVFEDPPTGRATAECLSACLAQASNCPLVLADLNGTERRAWDWGLAMSRLGGDASLSNATVWLPAASFGDTGAAAGAVAVCMAVRAFERGYAPSTTAIVALSSESGERGALALRAGAS